MPSKKSPKGKKSSGDGIGAERLFMIEFLVDKCVIFQRSLPRKLRTIPGETCLSFNMFCQKPIEISESDFMSCVTYAAPCEIKKNGKSALFALTPGDCESLRENFNVNICVFKKYICPFLPEKMQVGFCTISLKKRFNDLMKSLKRRGASGRAAGVCQEITGKMINGMLPGSGCCIGEMNLIIRMSCFGKTIVTAFTMNIPENSIFFKDRDGTSTYKYIKPIMPRVAGGSSCCNQVPVMCSRPATDDNRRSGRVLEGVGSEASCHSECKGPDECSYEENDQDQGGDKYQSSPVYTTPRFPRCSFSAPCQGQPCGFPPCTFPPCDILIPPPVPQCAKLPKTIVACGVRPTLMKPCDPTCGTYPCDYVPCGPPCGRLPGGGGGCGGCGSCGNLSCGPLPLCRPSSACELPVCRPPSPTCYPLTCYPSSCYPLSCYPLSCYPPSCYPSPCYPFVGCGSCRSPCGFPCDWYPFGLYPYGTAPCGRNCNGEAPCGASCGSPPYGVPPCKCCRPRSRGCGSPCPGPCRTCGGPCTGPCRALLLDPCGYPCMPKPGPPPCHPPCFPQPCAPQSCAPPSCGQPCGSPCGQPCAPQPCGSPCGQPCGSPCGPLFGPSCGQPCGSPCGSPCGPLGSSCGQPCGSPCGPFGSSCGQPFGNTCGPPFRSSCGNPCGPSFGSCGPIIDPLCLPDSYFTPYCGPPTPCFFPPPCPSTTCLPALTCGTSNCGSLTCGSSPVCSYPCSDPPTWCDSTIIPLPCNPYPAGYPCDPVPGKKGTLKFPKPCSGSCGNSYCKDLLICGYPCGAAMEMDRCMPAPEFVSCRPCQMMKKKRIEMSKFAAKQFEMLDRQRRLMSGELGSNAPKKKYPKRL